MHVQTSEFSRKKSFFISWPCISNEPLANNKSIYEHQPGSLSISKHVEPRPSKSGNTIKKVKFIKTRRGGKKFRKKQIQTFTFLGNNSAGIKSKKDSLEALAKTLNYPSCITLQETKLGSKEIFQLSNYQVFQKNRNIYGGGLITAVKPELNPMLISSKYQPSGAGGTRSPPATPHRLQHLTARLIQNGRRGLEIG